MTQVIVDYSNDQEFVGIVKSKARLNGNHLRMFQFELHSMAEDRELTLTDLRVYIMILAHTDFENKIQISQSHLGEQLDIDQANVSRSIKKLCEKKVLIETGNVGKQKIYHLNPEFGWKGRASRLGVAISCIQKGDAPGQRSYTASELSLEEIPEYNLVETLSKQTDTPTETIKRILEALSLMG